MASIFGSPLTLTQTAIGSLLEQRAVVLYAQDDNYKLPVESVLGTKSALGDEYLPALIRANLDESIGYLVEQNQLKELFRGIEVPYLTNLNGFNSYGVSYLSSKVEISSDIAEHPIEDGTMITDASILKPITAEVQIVMPTALYTRIYEQVYDYYVKKKKIMLRTKFGIIKNMVIQQMPYELKNEEIDRPVIVLSLRQIFEVSPENVIREFSDEMVRKPSDADTQDNGRRVSNEVAKVLLGGK